MSTLYVKTITSEDGTLEIANTVNANVVNMTTGSIGGEYISPVMGVYKNKIINGNFDIWQRGVSNTSIATNQLLADRWQFYRSGSTGNISRQQFTPGQTDVPGEPRYYIRSVVASSAGASNYFQLGQKIESLRTLAGRTATVSFWAKTDSSRNIAMEFWNAFGSGGSPSSIAYTDVSPATFALTTSWQKFTWTFTVPSILGKTLGTDENDCHRLNFWFDAGSTFNSRSNSLGQQSGTFDIAQVQLEEGPVATPFEHRHIGQELALCQRYYCTGFSDTGGAIGQKYGNTVGTFAFNAIHTTPVSMRDVPTVSVTTPTYQNCTTMEGAGTTVDGFITRTNITDLGFYRAYNYTWTMDAEL